MLKDVWHLPHPPCKLLANFEYAPSELRLFPQQPNTRIAFFNDPSSPFSAPVSPKAVFCRVCVPQNEPHAQDDWPFPCTLPSSQGRDLAYDAFRHR